MFRVVRCNFRINSLFLLSSRSFSKIIYHTPIRTVDYTNSIEDQYFPSIVIIINFYNNIGKFKTSSSRKQLQFSIICSSTIKQEIQEFNNELKELFGDLSIADPLSFDPLQNGFSSDLNTQNYKSKE